MKTHFIQTLTLTLYQANGQVSYSRFLKGTGRGGPGGMNLERKVGVEIGAQNRGMGGAGMGMSMGAGGQGVGLGASQTVSTGEADTIISPDPYQDDRFLVIPTSLSTRLKLVRRIRAHD
ncbi:hypothetical protein F4604DRAFT_1686018 [Suillus subluteus]|nr:hypothetical protein F4604DRAFT_1686018 [Suillus subluteus]